MGGTESSSYIGLNKEILLPLSQVWLEISIGEEKSDLQDKRVLPHCGPIRGKKSYNL